MNEIDLTCKDEQRRVKVRTSQLYGLDYLEVSEDHQLTVYFLGKAPTGWGKNNVRNLRIEGGRRIRDIQVSEIDIHREDAELDDFMVVTVDKYGDFSTYKLCIVALDKDGHQTNDPYPSFDPRYAQIDFTFKAGCPSDLDCKTEVVCPPEKREEPEINYLAKDYASFRQLILDRLALIMPDWKERHVPDIGITLVEVLAYVGDYLSYYQDAVATEAYLDTARQRISVRRHARLVDYQMHEGCNARSWVCVDTQSDLRDLGASDFYFITTLGDASGKGLLGSDSVRGLPTGTCEVFEPLVGETVYKLRLIDLRHPEELILKLIDVSDELTKYLWAQLSEDVRNQLEDYRTNPSAAPPFQLLSALIGELNRTMETHVLPPANNAEPALEGEALVRRNRVQLEKVFPNELAKSEKIEFFASHSEIHFYTWGDQECCLPSGATTATLDDDDGPAEVATPAGPGSSEKKTGQKEAITNSHTAPDLPRKRKLHLRAGDVLIFEEVVGPETGDSADADPSRRHAVRLIKVERVVDLLNGRPVMEIEWAAEDALPFPFCLSVRLPAPQCKLVTDVSVAHGNVVLVDHGQTIDSPEPLGQVGKKGEVGECTCEGSVVEMTYLPEVFRPDPLKYGPVTYRQTLADGFPPASQLLLQDPRMAIPEVTLVGLPGVCPKPGDLSGPRTRDGINPADPKWLWYPQRDLLSSQRQDHHFVVETDNDGRAHLRFGDGELGQMPEACMIFNGRYRVGNGPAGNVGAETITTMVTRNQTVSGVHLRPRNPLPAQGGTAPEPVSEVRLFAPGAFRKDRQRAITADDYAWLAERHGKLQHAAAALRWTGSWYQVQVAVDPIGTEEADEPLLEEIAGYLDRYRRMGHDLEVRPARYVPLDIELTVCVLPHYLRGHVEAALLDILSNRVLPDGRLGFFHPDNLTFGEGVYLSKLVSAAQVVTGVESVMVTKLERQFEGPNGEIKSGILPLGPLEIAQLDNDPSFPEHGALKLTMGGGR